MRKEGRTNPKAEGNSCSWLASAADHQSGGLATQAACVRELLAQHFPGQRRREGGRVDANRGKDRRCDIALLATLRNLGVVGGQEDMRRAAVALGALVEAVVGADVDEGAVCDALLVELGHDLAQPGITIGESAVVLA